MLFQQAANTVALKSVNVAKMGMNLFCSREVLVKLKLKQGL